MRIQRPVQPVPLHDLERQMPEQQPTSSKRSSRSGCSEFWNLSHRGKGSLFDAEEIARLLSTASVNTG